MWIISRTSLIWLNNNLAIEFNHPLFRTNSLFQLHWMNNVQSRYLIPNLKIDIFNNIKCIFLLHILCYFFTGNIWRIFSYSADVRMPGISVLFFDSCFQIDLFSRIRYIRLTPSTTALFRSIVSFTACLHVCYQAFSFVI